MSTVIQSGTVTLTFSLSECKVFSITAHLGSFGLLLIRKDWVWYQQEALKIFPGLPTCDGYIVLSDAGYHFKDFVLTDV